MGIAKEKKVIKNGLIKHGGTHEVLSKRPIAGIERRRAELAGTDQSLAE
jgi:hypothetical protein